jgi:hypothetical protein
MTPIRVIISVLSLLLLSGLSACNRGEIKLTCDELQPYQEIVGGERIVVPEGLDSLDEFKEMPLPKSDTPPRPAGSKCIDLPPSIRSE